MKTQNAFLEACHTFIGNLQDRDLFKRHPNETKLYILINVIQCCQFWTIFVLASVLSASPLSKPKVLFVLEEEFVWLMIQL